MYKVVLLFISFPQVLKAAMSFLCSLLFKLNKPSSLSYKLIPFRSDCEEASWLRKGLVIALVTQLWTTMSTLAACQVRTQTTQCCNKPEESIHLPCKEHGVTTGYKRSTGFVQHHLLKSPFLHGGQIVTLKSTQSDGRQSSCPVPTCRCIIVL